MARARRLDPEMVGVIALALVGLFIVATLPLVNWFPGVSWHDQQRGGQVVLIVMACSALGLASLRRSSPALADSTTRLVVAAVLVLGLVSAVTAHRPFWAIVEICLAVGSVGLGLAIGAARVKWGPHIDRLLLGLIAFVCSALTLQFLLGYAAALTNGLGLIDVWLLLEGFSNPRFYGQFLTLALPVLAVPLLTSDDAKRYFVPALVLLVLMWTIAIASGTRATWLGMFAAGAWLALSGPMGRRWAAWNALAASIGALLFWLSMQVLPALLGMATANAAARLSASLSLRDVIWRQATEMISARPVLGFGPMHFADLPNPVAAHPHQAWLQWAAEWGVPSALLVTWLVVRAARQVFRTFRTEPVSRTLPHALRLCLTGAMAAALTHSMVDGVLVMPYTQVWLALLGGWLLGLYRSDSRWRLPCGDMRCIEPGFSWRAGLSVSVLTAACILNFTVVRDFPHLFEREQAHARTVGGKLQPRFWGQGVIAQMPQD